ncbi:ATP-binding protein [Planctomycetota bacterium]
MTSNSPFTHLVVLESIPSAGVEACKKILAELKANKFDKDDIFAVHLALEEALTNAVKHGNKMDPRKQVKIEYSVTDEKIDVCISDQGQGFAPERIADPRYGQNLYKTGGRGLFLIRSYMDTVKFNERGNCVRMVKFRQKPPGPSTKNYSN